MSRQYEGELQQLDEFTWLLPATRPDMRTSGLIVSDEVLMRDLAGDAALQQVANVACLPGIVGQAMAMPDCHYGYGFPIGGVAAFDTSDGIISPGGVGYDINCGVRLLRTDLVDHDVRQRLDALADRIFANVPAGVGGKSELRLSEDELARVLTRGAAWAVAQGLGNDDDLEVTEERGCMAGAEPDALSEKAIKRGRPQLGTLGSGNHFLEIQRVDHIYDPAAAGAMGVKAVGQVLIMIHTGSRGLGYQVCDDALGPMKRASEKYDISLPDKQLACAPLDSPEGREYFAAMACAANYGWCNRQVITHQVREAFERVLGQSAAHLGLEMVYDVAHNVAKFEDHTVDGQARRLCVHRKGATRAFGPGRSEVPARYRAIGQPVILPGDMGTASYLLAGTEEAMQRTFGSTAHGAGRVMSRKQALRAQTAAEVAAKLADSGIVVRAAGKKTLAEEAPEAYKDVDRVVRACEGAGISKPVARMTPMGVVKG